MRSRKRNVLKIGVLCLALTAVIGSGTACLLRDNTPLITYKAEAQEGDSVWSICSRIASDEDNMSELVWRTMEENHIKDPTAIQPGQILTVRVKEHK